MKEYQEQFRRYWETFIAHLTAEINRRGEKQLPSHTVMNMILTDAALDWDSNETMCGRWLRSVCEQKPRMGQTVRAVLVDDMCFRQAEHPKGVVKYLLLLLPVVLAAAGFGIAWLLGAELWLRLVCAAVAGLVMIPVVMLLEKQAQIEEKKKTVKAYIDQLDMYYHSVISVLGE